MTRAASVDVYLHGLAGMLTTAQAEGGLSGADTAALRLWLARATCTQTGGVDVMSHYVHDLQLVCDTEEMPLAALNYYYLQYQKHHATPARSPAYVLYAVPVHLKPDRDRLFLFGPQDLDLSLAEAQAIAADIEQHFRGEGWRFECHDALQWFLLLENDPGVRFSPLADVVGKSVSDYLPGGANARQWRVAGNEIQMLLHDHSVNLAREQRNVPAINSLWFWGGGPVSWLRMPPRSQSRADGHSSGHVWTNNNSAAGLSLVAGVSVAALPAQAHTCIEAMSGDVKHRLFLDLTQWHARLSAVEKVTSLNRDWLAPLLDALAQKQLAELCLIDDLGRSFRLHRGQLKRWWQRPRPLTHYFPAAPGQ